MSLWLHTVLSCVIKRLPGFVLPELFELGLATFKRLRFPKELSCSVHFRSALSCHGHHGHCVLVLGLQLVVRSLEDWHFLIAFVWNPASWAEYAPRLFSTQVNTPSQSAEFTWPALCPSSPDQSIDSPDRVPSSGIGAACAVHKEQHQQFAFFILPEI